MEIHKCNAALMWVLVFAVLVFVVPRNAEIESQARAAVTYRPPSPPPVDVVDGMFERNATLSATLGAFDLSTVLIHEITEAVRDVFNPRQFRPGQSYRLVRDVSGDFLSFEYVIDEESTLKVQRTDEGGFVATREQLPLDVYTEGIVAEVNSSLWGALSDYPRGDQLVMELVNVYQSQVDFYRDIRQGDGIRFLVEAMYHRGEFVKYGRILAAEFVNQGRPLGAFRFQDEYYDENGMSTRRSFLPAPLEFTRISSNFSNARLHPILNTVRAHRGVDYAAPTGTPVWAASSGTVTYAGTNGSFGRFVRIRHSDDITTEYAHLSSILVNVGQRVEQQDVIGRVGMTGTATGPHLHYQMLIGGSHVNPRTARVDTPKPIDDRLRPAFMASIVDPSAQLRAMSIEMPVLLAEE